MERSASYSLKYRVIQESIIFWEMIISVIVWEKKKP